MQLSKLITIITFLATTAVARSHELTDRPTHTGVCENTAFEARERLSTPRGACQASLSPILLQAARCASFLFNRRPEDVPAYPSDMTATLQPDPADVCDFWNVLVSTYPEFKEKAKKDPSFRHKFSRLKYTKF